MDTYGSPMGMSGVGGGVEVGSVVARASSTWLTSECRVIGLSKLRCRAVPTYCNQDQHRERKPRSLIENKIEVDVDPLSLP
jgi:hypothetical protein